MTHATSNGILVCGRASHRHSLKECKASPSSYHECRIHLGWNRWQCAWCPAVKFATCSQRDC